MIVIEDPGVTKMLSGSVAGSSGFVDTVGLLAVYVPVPTSGRSAMALIATVAGPLPVVLLSVHIAVPPDVGSLRRVDDVDAGARVLDTAWPFSPVTIVECLATPPSICL